MNKTSFEELVKSFEDPKRETRQKPDEIIALFGDISGKTIIDIGSGTGYYSFRLAEKGAKVIATDVDERFLEYMEKKKVEIQDSLVSTRLTEYNDPLLSPQEVDHAIIVNTYHHIDNRIRYFKKVFEGLKERGVLMVVDFKKQESSHGPPLAHRIAKEQVMKELKQSGFSSFEIDTNRLEDYYIIQARK